ncbi:hypothetical protein B0O99DRAFT_608086 [Bisporella sp. PMI_857]|nr:hypothetical protein B0O99DRAFT_608086 [Bisporella sp. PMI_857]
MTTPSEWYKENFLVSTAKSLIDVAAVNKAFGTDSLYWAKEMDEEQLKKALDKSLCFGLYELPQSTVTISGQSNPRQIGLARLITDEVTFAYLTDVYVLGEYQGKGVGSWLIDCVNETLESWPHLRRSMLLASEGQGADFYTRKLGLKVFHEGSLKVMTKKGRGAAV